MHDLALGTRSGLPEPLRVLVEQCPRAGWEAHPHFTALTRFWLDRHLMFRRLQGMLVTETEAFLDGSSDPRSFGRDLSRLAGIFLIELQGHHSIEDLHYFPMLKQLDARLGTGFDLLDADHHVLDRDLHTMAEATNAVLRAVGEGAAATDAAGRLHGEIVRLGRLLDRHLTDEEEIVVPVILANPGAGQY